MTKTVTQFESFGRKYQIEIESGKSITIKTEANSYHDGVRTFEKTFKVGDIAEYDSYNLRYLGKITSITEKTVTIQPKFGSQKKRLKLESFAWRNYDFDLEAAHKHNSEEMLYI